MTGAKKIPACVPRTRPSPGWLAEHAGGGRCRRGPGCPLLLASPSAPARVPFNKTHGFDSVSGT